MRGPKLEEFFSAAPSRYFLDFYPGVIAEHFTDLRSYLARHGKEAFDWSDMIAEKTDHRKPGYSAITLIVKDKTGLFFRIAGTLFANRINILSAGGPPIGDIAA